MRAELADGRVLEFPDGTDPAVIQATVKKMINQDAQLEMQATAPQADQSAREQINEVILSTGFGKALSEFGSSIGRGATETLDFFLTDPVNAVLELSGVDAKIPTATEALSPATKGGFMEPGLARDVVQTAGELVPAAASIGAALRGTASQLPKIGQATESTLQGVTRSLGATTPAVDVGFGFLAGTGSEIGGEVGEEVGGPTGRVIGEQVGGLLAPISASVVKNSGQKVFTGTVKKLLKESAPTIDGLKSTARKVYRQIDDLGTVIKSEKVDLLTSKLNNTLKKAGYHPKLHPKVAVTLEQLAEKQGIDQTTTDIDILRKIANSARASADPDEQRIGKIVTDNIDDFLDNVKPQDFRNGGGNVGALYKDARQLWGRAKKAELLEEAFTKAGLQATGFENGIRVQLRQILNNKRKRSGFTGAEVSAMREVVKGGNLQNMAKMLGRFGFSEGQASNMLLGSLGSAGGFAVGGVGGGVAVPLVGQVSRKLAQKLTRGSAEFADAVVRAGKDGQSVVKAYLKAVPRKQRDSRELAELLIRPSVSINKIKLMEASKEQKLLLDNAVFYAEAAREIKNIQGEN